MTPTSPVLPSAKNVTELVFGAGQPQYVPLPAVRCTDGTVITRWKLNEAERIKIAVTGEIYLTILTFGEQLQPVVLSADEPKVEVK